MPPARPSKSVDRVTESEPCLYHRVLGEQWHALPRSLREMHALELPRTVAGRAQVRRGTGVLARAIAWMFGFPPSAEDVPVEVHFDLRGERQVWTRRFGQSASFSSDQWAGSGKFAGLLCERFGAFTFGLALVVEDGCMRLQMRRATLAGIPLPAPLMPVSHSREFEEDERFRFDVEIRHPLAGLIVAYRGWLLRA